MSTDTTKYKFNHTMIRVRDAKESLKFYQDVLGMKLLNRHDSEAGKFTLYFLAYHEDALPENKDSDIQFSREGVLELTHNWGTETDSGFKYHTGNTEPRGFGHIAIVVDNLEAACKRFEDLGVKFQKKLNEGSMKNIAFILDPDGYWIEVLGSRV